eukprot:366453-Chlamydomonas_euryale.AAC.11
MTVAKNATRPRPHPRPPASHPRPARAPRIGQLQGCCADMWPVADLQRCAAAAMSAAAGYLVWVCYIAGHPATGHCHVSSRAVICEVELGRQLWPLSQQLWLSHVSSRAVISQV